MRYFFACFPGRLFPLSQSGAALDGVVARAFLARMKYRVILLPSEEGFAVSCPALPGCWSQGKDEAEALANIRIAIGEYLEAQTVLLAEEALTDGGRALVREVELAVP